MNIRTFGPVASRLLQAAALVMMIVMALPGRADDRGIKSKAAPIYPDIARRLHVSGTVNVQAVVDANGNVLNAKAVSGNALLGPAAEDAVRKWKFDGGSGETKVSVNIEFVANN